MSEKAVIIDTKQSKIISDFLNRKFTLESLLVAKEDKLSAVAEKIINLNVTTVFINIEGVFENNNRTSFKGVELIFWLRLKHNFTGSIITYSTLAIAKILRLKPQFVVVFAEGNHHWRLGDPFPTNTSKLSTSIITAYLPFLKAVNAENTLRHSHANIWSVIKLHKIWNNYNNIGKSEEIKQLQNKINDNLYFLIADFLFRTENIETQTSYQEIKQEITETHNTLGDFSKKILLIDDMAEQGWSSLLSSILNCNLNEDEEFFTLSDIKNNTSLEIAEKAIREIEAKNINLILLDLRLKDEKGEININDISGFKVLKILKKTRPDIPVIIISASNKIKTTKELKNIGVYAVWTKQGHDNFVSSFELRVSILELMQYVKEVYTHFFKHEIDNVLYETDYRLSKNIYKEIPKEEKEVIITYGRNQIELSAIDVCVIDTNIWLGKEYVHNMLLVRRLSEILNKPDKELIIHNHVYSEVLKYSKPIYNDKNQRFDIALFKIARKSLEIIDKLVTEKKLTIFDYRRDVYAEKAYADPRILDYALTRALGFQEKNLVKDLAKNVMVLSNDFELRFKGGHLKGLYDKETKKRTQIVMRTSEELYKDLFNTE